MLYMMTHITMSVLSCPGIATVAVKLLTQLYWINRDCSYIAAVCSLCKKSDICFWLDSNRSVVKGQTANSFIASLRCLSLEAEG